MALSILRDSDVKTLLAQLQSDDVGALLSALTRALQAVSIGDEGRYQCHRQVVSRPGASSMLFMPATLQESSSIKVVGVPPPHDPASGTQPKALVGAVMIFDADGRAIGLINAAEVTAFRTSLGSILLYRYRKVTRQIVIFGAGKQALWHLRLALILRGTDVESVTIVNRSVHRAENLLDRLRQMDQDGYRTQTEHVKFSILDMSPEAKDDVYNAVVGADVVFCTTPSTAPLFPAEWLTSDQAKRKTRFISAIGSFKLDMQEIDPALLHAITSKNNPFPDSSYHPKNRKTSNGGVIIVDTREGCAVEAGELVKAEVSEDHIMEVGELTHLLETDEKRVVRDWLEDGFVLYKSVGLGIMDLAISQELLQQASCRGIGTSLDAF